MLLDLFGGGGGLFGQTLHFARHNGKAAARCADTRGFDGGIERQEVGLIGDAIDRS